MQKVANNHATANSPRRNRKEETMQSFMQIASTLCELFYDGTDGATINTNLSSTGDIPPKVMRFIENMILAESKHIRKNVFIFVASAAPIVANYFCERDCCWFRTHSRCRQKKTLAVLLAGKKHAAHAFMPLPSPVAIVYQLLRFLFCRHTPPPPHFARAAS